MCGICKPSYFNVVYQMCYLVKADHLSIDADVVYIAQTAMNHTVRLVYLGIELHCICSVA